MRVPVDYISLKKKFKNTGLNKHYGIDLGWHSKGHENQPVYSAFEGKVIKIEYQRFSGGWVIHIQHNFGEGGYYCTEYGHLQSGSICVKVGQKIRTGQRIACMGKSGVCSGNHLHFGTYRGASINYSNKVNFLDPIRFLNIYPNQVANKESTDIIYHTRVVKGVPSEPLLVHNEPNTKKSSVCGELFNGDLVEYYGTYNGMAVVNTILGRWTTNKYLK